MLFETLATFYCIVRTESKLTYRETIKLDTPVIK